MKGRWSRVQGKPYARDFFTPKQKSAQGAWNTQVDIGGKSDPGRNPVHSSFVHSGTVFQVLEAPRGISQGSTTCSRKSGEAGPLAAGPPPPSPSRPRGAAAWPRPHFSGCVLISTRQGFCHPFWEATSPSVCRARKEALFSLNPPHTCQALGPRPLG